jgi:hypothetical protein
MYTKTVKIERWKEQDRRHKTRDVKYVIKKEKKS